MPNSHLTEVITVIFYINIFSSLILGKININTPQLEHFIRKKYNFIFI